MTLFKSVQDAVFFSDDSDAAVMRQIMTLPLEMLAAKRAAVGAIRRRLYISNKVVATAILSNLGARF